MKRTKRRMMDMLKKAWIVRLGSDTQDTQSQLSLFALYEVFG